MMKKVIALMIGSVLAAGAMAADKGTATDTAQWVVTATKDSKARLVVTPIGKIDFKYSPASKQFGPTDANFMVEILNDTGAAYAGDPAVSATNFKLEAYQTEGYAAHIDGSGAKFNVELQKEGKALGTSLADATVLNDTTTSKAFLANLDGLLAGKSSDKGAFKAYAKPVSGTIDALPDGNYTGQATVAFKATWS